MGCDYRISEPRRISPFGKWCLHSYYTVNPWAPDGTGRILYGAADLEKGTAAVCIGTESGEELDCLGESEYSPSFYHTGFWQTWAPDSKTVYCQGGSNAVPKIRRICIADGREETMPGDMEGLSPAGEPILSGLIGMLYAAGYKDGNYDLSQAPVPFGQRDRHGLFSFSFSDRSAVLKLSVQEILETHPHRDLLLKEEKELKGRLGQQERLTLMCYCVRCSPDGQKCLFYFGNHCVDRRRGEPRISYVYAAGRDLSDYHMVLDLSGSRRGVHWSWHPDGRHLIGYGPDPQETGKICLALAAEDGSEYRKISSHASGGHPSVSPMDENLIVTDEYFGRDGRIVLIDMRSGREIAAERFNRACTDVPLGRNARLVDFHPVFRPDGRQILFNMMPEREAGVYLMDIET